MTAGSIRPRTTGRSPWSGKLVGSLLLTALLFGSAAATAQNTLVTPYGKNKVRYGKFDWHIYSSPHFSVYYYPTFEDKLEKVVSMAESAYDRLSRDFDYQIQEPTPLVLYQTHSDFLQNNIILNFIPEGVAAFATPARFRMVMPIDLPDNELYELLLHELTHIFQYHVVFGGGLGRSLTLNPPQWFMEGMASYFADDETTSDKMVLRDAVVNDRLPPVTQGNVSGFFAYRYGHAVFDFMEERWGRDGVIDFIFEFRNTLGARVGRAVERVFRMDPEDFDMEFRRWLRRKYLPELVATGEPSDFGRPFRTQAGGTQEVAPAASPSGDLVAAFSTVDQDLDIVLFDTQNRRLVRNLTKGYNRGFQNFVAQNLTLGRRHGSDLAFSPDGNQVAAFVRKEAGYSLALVNVLKGGVDRVIDMAIEQQSSLTWSPDGRTIAFAGNRNAQFDIFLLDLETLEIRNLTKDEIYDSAPTFSPDGKKLAFVSIANESGQLYEIDLDDPSQRYRITNDEFHNTDPVYGSDGGTVYFTSDRTGAENIYGINLASGQMAQYTNAITGCFMPTVLAQPGQPDRLVYTGFWRGRYDLYENSVEEPVSVIEVEDVRLPTAADEITRFEPDIQVSIDDANKEDKRGFKLFLEDAQAFAGINDDQTVLGNIQLQFADFLGDRRLYALAQSIESFSNFLVTYADLSRRWQWSASVFDSRTFFVFRNFDEGGRLDRFQDAFRQTGVRGQITYPLSFNRRLEFDLSLNSREFGFESFAVDNRGNLIVDDMGNAIPVISPREDEYAQIGIGFVSDTTIFGPAGPSGGHRVRLGASYAPDLDESGTLESSIDIDARKYFPLTRRSTFAMRGYGAFRDGNFPTPVFFGGFDTVRGVEFRDLQGDQGFFTNMELRFPLIDYFITPWLSFQGIQGRVFLDIAGAWYDDAQEFDIWDSENDRLDDAIASYGVGVSVSFFGVDLHWDVGKRWDFDQSGEEFTNFWVGRRF